MGAWGHGIFESDFALEVRESYLERLYEGDDDEVAAASVIEEYGRLDVDEHPDFWLSLAKTANDYGRLTEGVKKGALDVIASGADLARWGDNDGKRKRVLVRLAKELEAPAKPRKKLSKRRPALKAGDVFRLPLGERRYGFGRVLTQTERAFHAFTSADKRPPVEAVVDSEVLFVVGSTDNGFASRRWFVIGNAPIGMASMEPVWVAHHPVGSATCTLRDVLGVVPGVEERPVEECRGMELWGAWSAHHVEDRLRMALRGDGESCRWIPRV